MIKKIYIIYQYLSKILILGIILASCSAPHKPIPVSITSGPSPSATLFRATASPTPSTTFTPTITVSSTLTTTPLPSKTSQPTQTPSLTPTATWIYNDTGEVTAPILLYHHIADISPTNRYYVSPENFRMQMKSLKDWGYTTISPTYLRQVIIYGGELPDRPVIVTFDDGDVDVFENAFPIMHEFGYIGAFYIVSSRIGAVGYVSVEQLTDLVHAGWEIGSHSTNHYDLTTNHAIVRSEMLQSRLDIQDAISTTVTSFAYPYGLVDEYIANQAQEYGYTTGMGLGTLTVHTWGSIYYLNRREVHGDIDIAAFANLLPWSGSIPTPDLAEKVNLEITPTITP